MEDKATRLISGMDELSLSSTHIGSVPRSSSSDHLLEVRNTAGAVSLTVHGDLTDPSGLTQGDKLRALKSRRHPRPAVTGPLSSRTRSMQQEVNNNSTLYSSSVAPPAGKGYIRPQPQDIGAYRGHGPYSAMKGPSGRYLSRSIPSLRSEYIQY
ncbi:hypothetical protein XENOCAPTIV_024599 [Xenoophorus captivus]|uniref:Uncharacterized protein n=1 Tax=Xenoophorus captivus TaxID=1517983 RepID=A0ABV0R4P8_9TELE